MTGLPPDQQREHDRDLAEMLAAFNATMDAVVTETRYYLLGEREDADQIVAYGNIMQRAAARRRERERKASE